MRLELYQMDSISPKYVLPVRIFATRATRTSRLSLQQLATRLRKLRLMTFLPERRWGRRLILAGLQKMPITTISHGQLIGEIILVFKAPLLLHLALKLEETGLSLPATHGHKRVRTRQLQQRVIAR